MIREFARFVKKYDVYYFNEDTNNSWYKHKTIRGVELQNSSFTSILSSVSYKIVLEKGEKIERGALIIEQEDGRNKIWAVTFVEDDLSKPYLIVQRCTNKLAVGSAIPHPVVVENRSLRSIIGNNNLLLDRSGLNISVPATTFTRNLSSGQRIFVGKQVYEIQSIDKISNTLNEKGMIEIMGELVPFAEGERDFVEQIDWEF